MARKYISYLNFPKGKVYLNKDGKAYIEYNKNYEKKFNSNMEKVQAYIDKTVAKHLMAYVSFKTGTQEKSIPVSSDYGSGEVVINVPYAEYQAYSKKIKKRVGKRGTYPFERMRTDKRQSILKEAIAYSRGLMNGLKD